mmetsp:Transcript_106816/g.344683  ORF Transcript_106816/g.344683 Transcript_106816/m.344683 type:complete len:749 (-) Transcript_106816:404-2650(-)
MARWPVVLLALLDRAVAELPERSARNRTQAMIAAPHPGIMLDLYRAVRARDLRQQLANDDLADLPGVLNYIHTEVVGEHVSCNTHYGHVKPSKRKLRCHHIDSIMRARFYVRNPEALIDEVGSLSQWVDFGWDNQFMDGKGTADVRRIKEYGDFVGVRKQDDARFPVSVPMYWFSLSGPCPNKKWRQKFHRRGHPSSGLRSGCMKYGHSRTRVRGGLCPPGVLPTGKRGCVYNYVPPSSADVLRLDDLVGITQEDCGHRPCRDFRDFRRHCTNRAYKKAFNYNRRRTRTFVRSRVCVEYDVHWKCAGDWQDPGCQRVPLEKRELGLPFWRGRGLEAANMRRLELLAKAFGIEGATEHRLVAPDVRANFTTCLYGDETRLCHPEPDEGGLYCSRLWAGVCQPCYIPNTAAALERPSTDPMCPWDLLRQSGDYHLVSTDFEMAWSTVDLRGACPSQDQPFGAGCPVFVWERSARRRTPHNATRLWVSFDLSSLQGEQILAAKVRVRTGGSPLLFLGRAASPVSPPSCSANFDQGQSRAFQAAEGGALEVDVFEWVRHWASGAEANRGMWIFLRASDARACFSSIELEVTRARFPFDCPSYFPRDICCIYQSTCTDSIPTDPARAPIDEDGFALVSAQQSTQAMKKFLERAVAELLPTATVDPEVLEDVAYWSWHRHPLPDRKLARVMEQLEASVGTSLGPAAGASPPPGRLLLQAPESQDASRPAAMSRAARAPQWVAVAVAALWPAARR